MEELLQTIKSIIPLSEKCERRLCEIWKPIFVKKGDFLFQEGKVCRHLYYIQRGSIICYHFSNDIKVCDWFRFENDFFNSSDSFLLQTVSTDNFEALEDTELLMINYEDYQRQYIDFPELGHLGRVLAEKYYLKNIIRMKYFQFTNVEEKYALLLKNEPELLTRVPLGHIASYLGITQESLSRIRGKK
ncbi:Crp/Fnr family transcriptional regulator [Flavobacterium sp.]|jgi:CRP-like cAMP-binding protein|uniref:Crp/Fnr family transcriptional regulator n=1 Tax=Flavobacterium sp. TaxID=239 RepID=UPI0037BE750C